MNSFSVRITEFALGDLEEGSHFYDRQEMGLGDYFYDTLIAEIESLQWLGGIHSHQKTLYKALSKRFPYTIYYTLKETQICVIAVLDQRRNPMHRYALLQKRTGEDHV